MSTLFSLDHAPVTGTVLFLLAVVLAYAFKWTERTRVLLLLAMGLGLRLFISTRNPLILQYWPTMDDSYYYFQIARNWVSGHGLAHDSFNSTTGFQPLFLLLIAPIFKFIPDRLAAVQAVLIFQSVVGTAGGYLLYRLARLLSGRAVGLFALAIWATATIFFTVNLNGLETNTSVFLLLATLYYYFAHFRGEALVRGDAVAAGSAPGYRQYLLLGLLLGVSFLGRIDLGLLIPILGIDILLRRQPGVTFAAKVPRLLVLGVAAALPILPWVLYNYIYFGSILPSSGQAIRFLSAAYGFHMIQEGPAAAGRYFELTQIPRDFYTIMMQRAGTEIDLMLHQTFPYKAAYVLLAAGLVFSFRAVLAELRRISFIFVFLIVLFFAYTCYIFGYWFFDRYLVPFAIGYLLVLFACVAQLGRDIDAGERPVLAKLAALGMPIVMAVLLHGSLIRITDTLRNNAPAKFYRTAQWLNANTPPDAIIGAFQTGITGYFLDRRFYGLDGKINIDSLHAMQDKTMDQYVVEKKIDYLVDWTWILDDLFTRRSSDPTFLSRQKLVWQGDADVYQLRAEPARP